VIVGESPFAPLLRPGERLLWQGRPIPRRFVLTPADVFLIPFSLLWGGFALFWEAGVIGSGAPLFFLMWGVPFVLFGLYFILGRFFVAYRQAVSTHYAVTDRRILIVSGLFRRGVTELDLRSIPAIDVRSAGDGVGTINFAPMPLGWMMQASWAPWMGVGAAPAFRAIADASRVHGIIHEAREQIR
jgi:hypothetical protein